MPALDTCHQHVVHALTKAGWMVAPKPFVIKLERGHTLFLDIEAQRQSQELLLVEVKCFPEGSADTRELYTALGQYMIYRSLLRRSNLDNLLYLAVPLDVYRSLFERMAIDAIAENQIQMIIVDLYEEEIVQWLT